MKITVQQASYAEKSILRNLTELYKYDLSEFDPEDDVNEFGLYEYMYLDHYWTEDGRYPYLVRADGSLAGFALVRELEAGIFWMAEFFVMKKYRRSGVGRSAACELFRMYPGGWKVAQMETNVPAQVFWKKTIGAYTAGDYREIREADWDGPILAFTARA